VGAVAPARLNVVAVAGLSFYTFSCLSYIADVYARRIPVERHVGFFALYVGYFPKILAGPIERAQPFLTAVRRGATFDDRLVTSGLQLMLWGLFKKVVIADRLAIFVDAAYARPGFAPPADLLLATYFFAFQLYCDFSGYSDIAIGVSRVLGIDLMDNFRRPYLSSSVSEFWARRWHLSLTAWFRDYVYFPLGGSRRSAVRTVVNVMIVFLLSGLWHGAAWTFVVWGALNGVFTVATTSASRIGRRWPASLRLRGPVRTLTASLVTFHLILITWVFFRAATLADAVTVFTRIAASATALPSLLAVRLATGEVMTAVVLIAVLLGIEILDERRDIWQRLERKPVGLRWAAYYALLGALVVLGTWNFEQFVYMQF
ncbi:MAG: MBOAT family protein, partial [Vicinamibacterales bacterium]